MAWAAVDVVVGRSDASLMRTKLLLTGTIVALAAGVFAIPSVLIGPDEPIPTGHEATVEAARAALLASVESNDGLRFTRLVCTADGGAMVVFEIRGLAVERWHDGGPQRGRI